MSVGHGFASICESRGRRGVDHGIKWGTPLAGSQRRAQGRNAERKAQGESGPWRRGSPSECPKDRDKRAKRDEKRCPPTFNGWPLSSHQES
jgi:hypothetical protein